MCSFEIAVKLFVLLFSCADEQSSDLLVLTVASAQTLSFVCVSISKFAVGMFVIGCKYFSSSFLLFSIEFDNIVVCSRVNSSFVLRFW